MHTGSNTLTIAVCLLFLLSFTRCGPAAEDTNSSDNEQPNIILIMADDLGYGDIGPYGQQKIQTPNLDKLAAEGTTFSQFYVASPVCAPTRSSLMTGLHAGHSPVRGNVSWPRGDMPLRDSDTTFVELLDEAGYITGMYGKWSLGLKGTSGAPNRKGFDEFLGYEDQSEAHDYYVDRLQAIQDGVTVNVDVDTTQYTHDLFVDASLDFIERHAKSESPFFLYLPFTIPHAALQVPEEALQPYLDDQGNNIFPETPFGGHSENYSAQQHPLVTYAAMVSRLDEGIGMIQEKLKKMGVADNTIVLFTSDNGPHAEGGYDPEYFDGNGPLRGMKRDLYEGGIRVPMVAWGPGVPKDERSDLVWANWDLYPTLLDLANIDYNCSAVDGLSMKQALLGGEVDQQHDYLYWEFRFRDTFKQAIRRENWKAVRFTNQDGSSHTELYNLDEDIGETNDLADEYPDRVNELQNLMDQSHKTPDHEEFRVPWIDG